MDWFNNTVKTFSVPFQPSFVSHPPLHPFLSLLVHALEQTAGHEGDGQEQDYNRAHNWCPNGHTETVDLERRQSWKAKEKHWLIYQMYHRRAHSRDLVIPIHHAANSIQSKTSSTQPQHKIWPLDKGFSDKVGHIDCYIKSVIQISWEEAGRNDKAHKPAHHEKDLKTSNEKGCRTINHFLI